MYRALNRINAVVVNVYFDTDAIVDEDVDVDVDVDIDSDVGVDANEDVDVDVDVQDNGNVDVYVDIDKIGLCKSCERWQAIKLLKSASLYYRQ